MQIADEKIEEKPKVEEKPIDVPVTINLPENSPLRRLVKPHNKISRKVLESDMERVAEEAKILYAICFEVNGLHHGAYAMAHSQIDDKDPLYFYVTADKEIIINPVITRHSNYEIDSKEGCVSSIEKGEKIVKRWHKCDLDYFTIMIDPEDSTKFKLSGIIKQSLSGKDSHIAQHEIDHLNGIFIYA